MKRFMQILGPAAAATAVAVAALAGAGAACAAGTAQLPADPAAKGYIGLCNQAGRNVTGGSTTTKPFVWKAVASSGPPSSYQGRGQTAVLGIVQPRTGTGPTEWNGTALTSASYYRNRHIPAAQATYDDASLSSFVKNFPPQVDGLYVLRMYFGKLNYGDYSATYPTTTIQVSGMHWRVVRGGTVDCAASRAVSDEQLTGAAGRRAVTPRKPSSLDRTVSTDRARTITAPASNGVSTGPGGRASGSASTPAVGSPSIDAAPAAETSTSSSLTWVVWALVALVLVLVAALGTVLRTRIAHLTTHHLTARREDREDKDRTRP